MGTQRARTGNGYAGIHIFYKKNYREYIQGRLKNRLERGKIYEIKFYISLSENSTHASSNIELQFYNTKTVSFSDKNLKKNAHNLKIISNSDIRQEAYGWLEMNATYTAKGFENYFIIGNFEKNSELNKSKIPNRIGKSKIYYFIDDVSIKSLKKEEIKEEIKEEVAISEEPEIKTNKVYTFKNVLFDFDKAKLLDISINELNRLYDDLKGNLTLYIEIYGHTDNIGLDSRNKELSEQRAKAVTDYLISQGLDESRIQSYGFGCSKPISNNETEEGRKLNRRVEFKLIDN